MNRREKDLEKGEGMGISSDEESDSDSIPSSNGERPSIVPTSVIPPVAGLPMKSLFRVTDDDDYDRCYEEDLENQDSSYQDDYIEDSSVAGNAELRAYGGAKKRFIATRRDQSLGTIPEALPDNETTVRHTIAQSEFGKRSRGSGMNYTYSEETKQKSPSTIKSNNRQSMNLTNEDEPRQTLDPRNSLDENIKILCSDILSGNPKKKAAYGSVKSEEGPSDIDIQSRGRKTEKSQSSKKSRKTEKSHKSEKNKKSERSKKSEKRIISEKDEESHSSEESEESKSPSPKSGAKVNFGAIKESQNSSDELDVNNSSSEESSSTSENADASMKKKVTTSILKNPNKVKANLPVEDSNSIWSDDKKNVEILSESHSDSFCKDMDADQSEHKEDKQIESEFKSKIKMLEREQDALKAKIQKKWQQVSSTEVLKKASENDDLLKSYFIDEISRAAKNSEAVQPFDKNMSKKRYQRLKSRSLASHDLSIFNFKDLILKECMAKDIDLTVTERDKETIEHVKERVRAFASMQKNNS
ncbi:unnamed protein product [Moneuplotes crassus]|uniref:Uncharacterized protein n=1 Tax=Euplotes crassus TaxID=5936 RepID=A0AAD1U047_EUPCR|nr:unnamed protein product [Moneuplotes crassus]